MAMRSAAEPYSWRVSRGESGLKLAAFIKGKLADALSGRRIKESIERGHCTLNGRPERFASRFVGSGDIIVFSLPDAPQDSIDPLAIKRSLAAHLAEQILFCDSHLIALNKPSHLNSDDPVLADILGAAYGSVELLHRLDRETSGVLLFARHRKAADALLALFKNRSMTKCYSAIVDGTPCHRAGTIENYLGKVASYEGQSLFGAVSKEKGQKAKTSWELKASSGDASFLACYPETGRTHQIRIHLSGIGHPILGDTQYGKTFCCRYRPGRLMLHARGLSFCHPATGKLLSLQAPYPEDFCRACKELGLLSSMDGLGGFDGLSDLGGFDD